MPDMRETGATAVQAARSATALLAASRGGSSLRCTFGSPDCPTGSVHVQPLDCCWEFGAGATTVIEQLCLGPSTGPIQVAWTCEPDSPLVANLFPSSGLGALDPSISDSRPWNVWHRDVTLLVFPTTLDINLVGDNGSSFVPAGAWIAELAFYPNGRHVYEPENLSAAVAKSFAIFELLSGCMDAARRQGLHVPVYFLGDSLEPRMVAYARRRLGFSAIDNGDVGATIFAPVDLAMRLALDRPARLRRLAARAKRASRIVLPGESSS